MAKKNKSLKAWYERKLPKSSAFRSLNKWAMLVYLDFLNKRQMEKMKSKSRCDDWIIINNGEIVYPYSEAEKNGVGRREFRNAIDELIQKGFLDITHQGSGGHSRDMTKYFIDDRWKEFGKPNFRLAKKPRQKDSRKGRGWEAYHTKKKKNSITKLIPKKKDPSNKLDTPRGKIKILSNSKSDTPKGGVCSITGCNH